MILSAEASECSHCIHSQRLSGHWHEWCKTWWLTTPTAAAAAAEMLSQACWLVTIVTTQFYRHRRDRIVANISRSAGSSSSPTPTLLLFSKPYRCHPSVKIGIFLLSVEWYVLVPRGIKDADNSEKAWRRYCYYMFCKAPTNSTVLPIGPVHTGNKVERTFNIRATKLTVSATMLKLHEY